MKGKKKNKFPYTQNRELSWLRFNERVLDESMEEDVPLLERLKYIAIFNSNLDEFFMVRVGSLYDIDYLTPKDIDKKSQMTASEQIDAILKTVQPLIVKKQQYFNIVQSQLEEYNIVNCSTEHLSKETEKEIKFIFNLYLKPILSPVIIDSHHPFPHLENKKVYILATLKQKNKHLLGIIPVPHNVPTIYSCSNESSHYFFTDQILLHYTEQIFENVEVVEKCCLRVTRNADINLDEVDDDNSEFNDDFKSKMKAALNKRKRLSPVRIELSKKMCKKTMDILYDKCNLTEKSCFISDQPMDLSFVYDFKKRISTEIQEKVLFKPFKPSIPAVLSTGSIMKYVKDNDVLLSYPYESMEPFLKLIKEASEDPSVVSIKITIYRLSSHSKLVSYLCVAASNGKDVTVLIELRARFDEQNNIDWSERLDKAGCHVIYGTQGYKVHSKICLITRKELGVARYYTQIGTGNYNENTALMYTDLSLITYHQGIGADANLFFQNMGISNLNGEYQHLLVAPTHLKPRILSCIERETLKKDAGKIVMKTNSLTDLDVIQALVKASQEGCKVDLIVRGNCCLLPQIDQITENIHITNIVGRFLEHSRVYCFGTGDSVEIYIASADLMTRNTEKRVEIACPIYSKQIKEKILNYIDLQMADNTKARNMMSDGRYVRKINQGNMMNSQEYMLQNAYVTKSEPSSLLTSFFKRFTSKFK